MNTGWLIAIISTTVCLLASFALASADELAFKPEKLLTITRAIDLVSDGEHKVTKVREQLTLTGRETARARDIRRKGFQVRVFSLRPGESEPGMYAPPIEDCLIFWSMVIPVPGSYDFKIALGEITEGWLVSSGKGVFEYGRFLLVFEEPGSTDRVFRIRRNYAEQYFKNGMLLTVTYDANLDRAQADIFAKAKEIIKVKLEAGAKVNSPAIPCYEYQPVRVADGALFASAGTLQLCANGHSSG
jgi:hypothetical protein